MQDILSIWLSLILLTSASSAQALTFDDFVWTFSGPPSSSGFVTSELMHVTGPASSSACSDEVAVFTTTAPFGGTVRAHLDWDILDICHFDWPIYVINGQVTQIPVSGDLSCFLPGSFELEFAVQAGDVFGFGVGSSDCFEGPGLADFTQFTLLPPDWVDVGAALDPRVVLDIPGPPGMKTFGLALAVIGDVDGDGLSELAVNGSPGYPADEFVTLHSGQDGEQLWSTSGPIAYGNNLVALGDVDGDGLPDVAASDRVQSSVRVLSGLDGGLIWSWTWAGSSLDYYGTGLAAHADIDGDGVLELAVGAAKLASLPVRVLSGATGALVKLIPPGLGDESFGYTLASAADVDLDGSIDLMIGATGTPSRVRVLSGATGLEILGLVPPPPSAGKWNGLRLAGAGDWNGDGIPDVAVAAPFDLAPTGGGGTVDVISGSDEALLLDIPAPEGTAQFGLGLAGGVDVNGDGLSDLVVGAPTAFYVLQPVSGRAFILGAPDGAVLQEFTGDATHGMGRSVAWFAGEPAPRLAVGMPAKDEPGRVFVFDDLLHPAGAPQLSMYGAMQGLTPWMLRVDHGLPGDLAWIVFGASALSAPFKGGVLVPNPDLLLPVGLDAAGTFEAGALAPAGLDPLLELWVQAWMKDPAGPAGWSATRSMMSPP